jgi:hypothetical protein
MIGNISLLKSYLRKVFLIKKLNMMKFKSLMFSVKKFF